jgi:putative ABC transport system substrate-binding protein
MQRRDFIKVVAGSAVVWPVAARAQQLPVVGFLNGSTPDASARYAAAFRKGLSETGNVEGRDLTVEYHWLEGQYERVPAVIADLVRRRVAVIASPGFPPGSLAAKAATTTIPIVFGVGDDPVKLGLVTSLARPGGNVTGINFFDHEIISKRLALLREFIPASARIAVLVNPRNTRAAETELKGVREVAPTLGVQILVFNASTADEIDATFAAIAREKVDALLVAADGFLNARRGQFATLSARDKLPTASSAREFAEAGNLMSYGTSIADMFRQVGIYAGSIVKGAKPAELPVLQLSKFEFVINLQTAKALGIKVPPALLARADEVIE